MTEQHTAEPWHLILGCGCQIQSADNQTVAMTHNNSKKFEDARRIVACVNACQGMSTEALEALDGDDLLLGLRMAMRGIIKA